MRVSAAWSRSPLSRSLDVTTGMPSSSASAVGQHGLRRCARTRQGHELRVEAVGRPLLRLVGAVDPRLAGQRRLGRPGRTRGENNGPARGEGLVGEVGRRRRRARARTRRRPRRSWTPRPESVRTPPPSRPAGRGRSTSRCRPRRHPTRRAPAGRVRRHRARPGARRPRSATTPPWRREPPPPATGRVPRRRRRCPSAPAGCRSSRSAARRSRWRCPVRRLRRRSRPPRRPRGPSGSRWRAASRAAYLAVSGSRPDDPRDGSHDDRHHQDHAEHRHDRGAGDPEGAVAAVGGDGAVGRRGDADAEEHQADDRASTHAGAGRRDDRPARRRRPGGSRATQVRRRRGPRRRGRRRRSRRGRATAGRRDRTSPLEPLHEREQCPARATMPSTRPMAGGDAAEHDAAAEDDPSGLGGRTSGRGDQRERARVSTRTDREGRPGEQDDLDQRHHDDQRDHGEGLVAAGVVAHLLGQGRDVGRIGEHRTRGDHAADRVQVTDGRPRHGAGVDEPLARSSRSAAGRRRDRGQRAGAVGRVAAGADDGQLVPATSISSPTDEALVEHRVVDDDLARGLGQAAALEVEEAGGERVGRSTPVVREVDDPLAQAGPASSRR